MNPTDADAGTGGAGGELSGRRGGRAWLGGAVFAAALAGALVVWFGRSCWGGWWVFDDSVLPDVYMLSTIWERWAAQVGAGHLPLWFPEFAGGHPVHAAWMYGLFYPPLALFSALPPEAAWTWLSLAHVVFGGVGMYAFLRHDRGDAVAAASGATVFALSGFMLGRVLCGHLNLVMPFAWLPWMLWNVARLARGEPGAALWLGLSGGASLLAGHVQMAFYAGPLVAAYAVFESLRTGALRAGLPRLLLAGAVAVGVSAIQWLPAWELFRFSGHPPEIPEAVVRASATGTALLTQFAPRFATGPYRHEFLGLAGPLALVAPILALRRGDSRRWFWCGVGLVGLVLAPGLHSAVSAWANELPPLRWGRTPGRALLLTVVAGSVLSGHLVANWFRGESKGRLLVPVAFAASAFAFGVPAPRLVSSGFDEIDWMQHLPAQVRDHRVAVVYARYPYVERFGARTLRDVCPVDTPGYVYMALMDGKLSVLAWWFDVSATMELELNLTPGAPEDEATLARRLKVRRFEAGGGAQWFDTAHADAADDEVLKRLGDGARELWIAGPPAAWDGPYDPASANGSARVSLLPRTSPTEIPFRVDGDRRGWVLVSEKWYPGWQYEGPSGAWHDARRGNLALLAVPSGPGDHVLVYRPWWLRPALLTTIATLLAALAAIAVRRRSTSESTTRPA